MDTKEKLERLNDSDFQMYLGVKRKTFYAALEILEKKSVTDCGLASMFMKISIFDRSQ